MAASIFPPHAGRTSSSRSLACLQKRQLNCSDQQHESYPDTSLLHLYYISHLVHPRILSSLCSHYTQDPSTSLWLHCHPPPIQPTIISHLHSCTSPSLVSLLRPLPPHSMTLLNTAAEESRARLSSAGNLLTALTSLEVKARLQTMAHCSPSDIISFLPLPLPPHRTCEAHPHFQAFAPALPSTQCAFSRYRPHLLHSFGHLLRCPFPVET